ncbi:hypothetical protein KG112_08615 [Nocardioides sp. zg-ZUI104]|uniref:hypothetical protein n=1 Tax=Nocardioides faecalis TaxID=2803858 RepID=UPI001BCAAE38|nr:hypothetical protein [Nocardioides faecalis]MBS4752867.1 hypothetical protein [Nocardioides faecalis]
MSQLHHPAGDITLAVPRHWRRRSDPARGVVLAARARELPASGLAPELVLRAVPITSGLDAWRTEATALLAGQLADFELEDAERYDLGGEEVDYRRFGHRVGDVAVVCDQWAWAFGDLGVTLTGSVAREDYLDYGDVFEEVATTVRIPGAAGWEP